MKTPIRLLTGLVGALGVMAIAATVHAAEVTGAGSTFAFPIYSKWAAAYKAVSGSGLNYQPIGSGGGIKQVESKTVTFGATDMPLPTSELNQYGLIQFPTVIGGVVPIVNVTGIKPGDFVLDGSTLANIYLSKITKWNDPAIKTLNPNANLPNQAILPIYRTRMLNHDGKVVSPIAAAFAGAASGAIWNQADGFATMLTDQPGAAAWPISGATWVLFYKNPADKAATVEGLKFFDWSFKNGDKLASDLDYVPFPAAVKQRIEASWTQVQGWPSR